MSRAHELEQALADAYADRNVDAFDVLLAELVQLAADAEHCDALLIAFEQIPVRRTTQTTVVLERRELDEWRQRCGEATS